MSAVIEQHWLILSGSLTEKILALSKEMERIVNWIQKSSDYISKYNSLRHNLADISSQQTNEQTIASKIEAVKVCSDHVW